MGKAWQIPMGAKKPSRKPRGGEVMMAEALFAMTTVWYIPGWMRTQEPRVDVMACVSNTYPNAKVEFKAWDGDRLVWPHAVESADKEAWRFAFEAATLPAAERENLVIVGHSLGGRIAARVLARLAEKGLMVRQASLLAAAIPADDADLGKMGGGSSLPVLAVCNPDDVTLRYVYALAGGEKAVAFGANGTLEKVPNVEEHVTPTDITRQVKIDADWAKVQFLKDIANHHEAFYFDYLRRIVEGEETSGAVMVPQSLPTLELKVTDTERWWVVLEAYKGWKLERNKLTGHARILDPTKVRKAWGTVDEMKKSFVKVKGQL